MARKITFELVKTGTDPLTRQYRGIVSDKYEGTMFYGPSVGKSFCFYPDKDAEYFYTSVVKNIEYVDDKTLILTTKNSEYRLTLGAEVEPK